MTDRLWTWLAGAGALLAALVMGVLAVLTRRRATDAPDLPTDVQDATHEAERVTVERIEGESVAVADQVAEVEAEPDELEQARKAARMRG